MNIEETRGTLKAFLMKSFRDYDFKFDEDIFSLGFVNSMFVMQLVNFVESTFAIELENEDLELDNFRSIDALAGLITRKKENP